MVKWVDNLSDYITERILNRKSVEPPKDNGEIKEAKKNLEIIRKEIEKNNFPVNESVEEKIDHGAVL